MAASVAVLRILAIVFALTYAALIYKKYFDWKEEGFKTTMIADGCLFLFSFFLFALI